jgi:4a-hydroxytetrahydrobiopterin dehydratase
MTSLRQRRCEPLEGGAPMSASEVASHIAQLDGWQLCTGAIEKTHRFGNFHQTMAFMNAVAWICHAEDHHPDVTLGYDRCVLRFSTHSVGGISINDFICAAKVDALMPARA